MAIGFVKAYALPKLAPVGTATADNVAMFDNLFTGSGQAQGSYVRALEQLDAGASARRGAELLQDVRAGFDSISEPLGEVRRGQSAIDMVMGELDTLAATQGDAIVQLPRHGTTMDAGIKQLRNAISELGMRLNYRVEHGPAVPR